MCVSFILSSRKSHQEIPNMDKSVLLSLYENMETLNIRLWQYMVYLCFSSHLQVINKVYEQCSANWHSIYYSIETILPYYCQTLSLSVSCVSPPLVPLFGCSCPHFLFISSLVPSPVLLIILFSSFVCPFKNPVFPASVSSLNVFTCVKFVSSDLGYQ